MKKRGYYSFKNGGKTYTGHFSLNFWALLEDDLKSNFGDVLTYIADGISLSKLRKLLYYSIKANSLEVKEECPLEDLVDAGTLLESLEPKDIEVVMEALTESKILSNDSNLGIQRKADTEGKPKA